jgi:TPR repeat protein
LGYLRWKNQGFGWLSSGANKPAATTEPSDSADSSTPAPPNSTPGPSADSSSNSSSQPSPAQPAPDGAASKPNLPANPAAKASGNAASSGDASPAANQPAAATPTAASDKDKDSDAAPAKPPAKAPARSKPSAAFVPTKPSPERAAEPVSEAQKYIYGKGVRQDCDHGLHLLKPAADHGNPKAMIEMGALYSAGLCTPRDLPTAYRWFALALRKQPDNTAVQTDLQKLWGEMTQPERQLAIRLSQ